MDESALERFFDEYICNTSSQQENQEDQRPRSTPDWNVPDGSPVHTVDEFPCRILSPEPDSLRLVPVIQNVIGSMELGCQLDLDLIARKTWNIEYNPETFKAAIMRIRRPRATANIFKTGKISCVGTKSVAELHQASRKFWRILQKLDFPMSSFNFRIHNIVASCKSGPLLLDQLYEAYRQCSSLEYELFPALFFRMESGITAIIFQTGKISLSGCKTDKQVKEAADVLSAILSPFRKAEL